MSDGISTEELEAALAEALDDEGNDVRLARYTARMTAEQRCASDENIRQWARGFRAALRADRDLPDAV